MIALNLNTETNRILSVCVVLSNGNYNGMPIVDTLPEGDITDYLYVDGEFIYDPLPEPEPVEPEPTVEERITALEEAYVKLDELVIKEEELNTSYTDGINSI